MSCMLTSASYTLSPVPCRLNLYPSSYTLSYVLLSYILHPTPYTLLLCALSTLRHSSPPQAPRDGLPISSWYPGDDVVDWCGVSIFTQPYACQLADKCQMPYAEDVAAFCKARQKPLMVAESTPFGGIVSTDGDNEAGIRGSSWNKWFVPVLSFINKVGLRSLPLFLPLSVVLLSFLDSHPTSLTSPPF